MDAIQTARKHGLNVIQYAIANEKMFEENFTNMGKKRKTTFFADLSIAEWFGEKHIKETYNQVIKEWGGNIEYITEFCVCLNHKIWQHYKENKSLANVYNDLWTACDEWIYEKYKDNERAINYYYETTD